MLSESCEKMQNSSKVQQLYKRWSVLLNQLQEDPIVGQLVNSRTGQYLSNHPFLALSLVLFSAMAVVPFGIFITFALVSIIMAAVGFIFFEVFLLFVGGLTLLCVLSGIAVFSVLVAVILNVAFVTTSKLTSCYNTIQTERDLSREKDSGDETSAETRE